MLGVDTKQPRITGRYAKAMRSAAVRVNTHTLNASDKEILERSKKILQEYQVVSDVSYNL